MKIYLGADHRGFELKEKLRIWLEKNDLAYEDMGAYNFEKYDDYTEYAEKVASMVADNIHDKGVLLCGSGVGVDIVANKFDGIRSAVAINPEQIEAARMHDNVNVLVLAADYTSERQAISMLEKFLNTEFDEEIRHEKRLEEIAKLEQNN